MAGEAGMAEYAKSVGTGVLGGILGGFGAMGASRQANRNVRDASNTVRGIKAALPGQTKEMTDILAGAYDPYTRNAASDLDAYRATVMGDRSAMQYDPADPFQYDLQAQTKAFLDPTVDYQVKQATGAVEGSAANAGKLFSGATGKAIADRSQEIAQQSWKDALQTALADRGFQFGVNQAGVQNERAAKDQALRIQQMQEAGMGNLAGMGQQAVTNLAGQKVGLLGQQYQGMNDADIQLANLLMGRSQTGAGAFLQGAAGGIAGAGAK